MNNAPRSKRVHPHYPTRQTLLAQPGVLRDHVPPAWKPLVTAGGLTVVFLVSGLAALPAGCTRDAGSTGGSGSTKQPATNCAATLTALTDKDSRVLLACVAIEPPVYVSEEEANLIAKEGKPIVAPIFEHGDGRAATGCVVVSPPVFISEEEARQIITEELGKVGLKMSQKDVELKEIGIRPKKLSTKDVAGKTELVQEPGDPHPLVADLMDPDKHVAVEFISQNDYHDLGGEMAMSTVSDYDFKKVGQELVEQIKAGKGRQRFGVFYDPATRSEYKAPSEKELEGKSSDEMTKIYQDLRAAQRAAAEKTAREELRLQVRDFAAWLKKQGVI